MLCFCPFWQSGTDKVNVYSFGFWHGTVPVRWENWEKIKVWDRGMGFYLQMNTTEDPSKHNLKCGKSHWTRSTDVCKTMKISQKDCKIMAKFLETWPSNSISRHSNHQTVTTVSWQWTWQGKNVDDGRNIATVSGRLTEAFGFNWKTHRFLR